MVHQFNIIEKCADGQKYTLAGFYGTAKQAVEVALGQTPSHGGWVTFEKDVPVVRNPFFKEKEKKEEDVIALLLKEYGF